MIEEEGLDNYNLGSENDENTYKSYKDQGENLFDQYEEKMSTANLTLHEDDHS
jgi:hypothetical protein